MRTLAILISFATLGCQDQPSYEGEVRAAQINLGTNGALKLFDTSALSTKNGADLYKLYRFISIYGDAVPSYEYASIDGMESILNCSAMTGFEPAIELAEEKMKSMQSNNVGRFRDCSVENAKATPSQKWKRCGAAFFPRCPQGFQK